MNLLENFLVVKASKIPAEQLRWDNCQVVLGTVGREMDGGI